MSQTFSLSDTEEPLWFMIHFLYLASRLPCPLMVPTSLASALPDSVQEKAPELNLYSPFPSILTCQMPSSYLRDLDALYRFLDRECLTLAWTPQSCICEYRNWRCVCLCIYPSTQLYSCFQDSARQVSKV